MDTCFKYYFKALEETELHRSLILFPAAFVTLEYNRFVIFEDIRMWSKETGNALLKGAALDSEMMKRRAQCLSTC